MANVIKVEWGPWIQAKGFGGCPYDIIDKYVQVEMVDGQGNRYLQEGVLTNQMAVYAAPCWNGGGWLHRNGSQVHFDRVARYRVQRIAVAVMPANPQVDLLKEIARTCKIQRKKRADG